ncbi:MAG: phenylalanine--tRNA ligase subunit alpha [Parcubacteria group bacterium CG1_02_39_15]|uniref:Phenylalanine--tRNA ligase alpha subunit n=2 Tax=Candidatus Nealsoniibacteriota TaxID=1817911 RepID=A0A2M7UVT3_9BACT|nr:MAG: phenylalanine--tRNA ligase subunit alpha [Parcubacteria group bacterium CG1_02_39_15]PIW90516.1 MAG: phenylalanine--tRNA ligase subunit alpha [Candidatus Nealsonbacteria bacterium CG_4_8_14_3_um_filter_40_11]PIZ88072.1 MAG: phenylalanine--tRNA ligase subunit alpha [Candidatus Nealsonbacteria bacterium CG_4_10_14_0_2_um_filter_39_15]
MPKINLKLLKKQAQREINRAGDLKFLNEIFKKYLGKRGELTLVLRSLERMPKAKRAKVGKEANELKTFLREKFEQKKFSFAKATEDKEEWIDVTRPGKKLVVGHLHPLTQVKRKVEEIFQAMGFSVVEGPEAENEWYNFDALNIPKDHPARDMWDTFYLKDGLLLRTHTTPVDARYMEKNNPPLRIITIGRCFRHEATDASHESNFYQIDGLMAGKDISVANFKAIIQEFFQRFFEKPVEIRMRPSYFPFTEPSFEVDMTCLVCGGKGCSACQQTGWMEMMGAGMMHPNVFKNSGLNPKNWQGFAFGMGLDRLTMMKYKINDIRLLYSGDLRFLKQF